MGGLLYTRLHPHFRRGIFGGLGSLARHFWPGSKRGIYFNYARRAVLALLRYLGESIPVQIKSSWLDFTRALSRLSRRARRPHPPSPLTEPTQISFPPSAQLLFGYTLLPGPLVYSKLAPTCTMVGLLISPQRCFPGRCFPRYDHRPAHIPRPDLCESGILGGSKLHRRRLGPESRNITPPLS